MTTSFKTIDCAQCGNESPLFYTFEIHGTKEFVCLECIENACICIRAYQTVSGKQEDK